ncbi:hypothetical protein [Streptomyces ficellus]|uniref:Uncharacterized protein n=1 Tax=Streptomyces ficellus TaxID=1977088 RepID=A0A6I6FEH4_9ACTN|nr:hypothetical protein [Streptomyces ficellus]QGV82070.1 hypothetical protein EIZ62_30290 [Streptomyces ficellus]
MRTPRAVATIPGEAVPEPAVGPLVAYAPVPRDARAPTAFGIAARSFPARCSPHRTGSAVVHITPYAAVAYAGVPGAAGTACAGPSRAVRP